MLKRVKHIVNRLIYKGYYKIKIYFLKRPPSFLSVSFFKLVNIACKILSNRPLIKDTSPQVLALRQDYLQKYPTPPFRLLTDDPVAVESDDHKQPRGSLYDNHKNNKFNEKLYGYFQGIKNLQCLDLGCAGGGFVHSFIRDGHTALGLEGSDISKRLGTGEWGVIPHHLFTCDITKPFTIQSVDGQTADFHCITAWEVLEHIPERELDTLIENIVRHLKPDGIFVGSVNFLPDGDPLTGAVYHVTLHDKEWWLEKFHIHNLVPVEAHPFIKQDYVRGHGQGLKDWDPDDGDGCHLVLRKNNTKTH